MSLGNAVEICNVNFDRHQLLKLLLLGMQAERKELQGLIDINQREADRIEAAFMNGGEAPKQRGRPPKAVQADVKTTDKRLNSAYRTKAFREKMRAVALANWAKRRRKAQKTMAAG